MLADDFNRNLWPIMGLPLDAMTMEAAIEKVYSAIDKNEPLFISTPNLNFVIASQTDHFFKQSVINSDLSLADGMPLVWVAKLLKIPIEERVSGSGLVSALIDVKSRVTKPVKAYFFGGPEGIAEQACQKLNQTACGVVGVGSHYPGFGTVEQMSEQSIIDEINDSGAEFVIVALGARKGQEWIELNREKLDAPVISHLGAVVNFVAGNNVRAPAIFQNLGLEWLWRIKEEPELWRRYFFDGVAFFKMLVTRVIPYSYFLYRNRVNKSEVSSFKIEKQEVEGQSLLLLKGSIRDEDLNELKNELKKISASIGVVIDLKEVEYFEPSFISFLFVLSKYFGENLKIQNVSSRITKIFKYNCAEFLLSIKV